MPTNNDATFWGKNHIESRLEINLFLLELTKGFIYGLLKSD